MQERLSTPPAKPADTSPAAAATALLAALLARFGSVPHATLRDRFAQASLLTLVTDGQRVTTERLVREAPAVIAGALAIVEQLLPEQRDLLVALDDDLFAGAATALDVCRQKGESRGTATRTVKQARKGHQTARHDALKRAQARRAIVYATASTLASGDPARKARLDEAWGRGDQPEHVAGSLTELVAILRELVADARARKQPTRVTAAWIDRQASAADELAQVSDRAGGLVAQGDVAQGDVAWWRGAALWFLRQMADLVDAAHEADPRVARLALGALRAVVRRPRSAKKKKPDAEKKAPAEKTSATKDAATKDAATKDAAEKADAPKPA
jgi:hypothetical protein